MKAPASRLSVIDLDSSTVTFKQRFHNLKNIYLREFSLVILELIAAIRQQASKFSHHLLFPDVIFADNGHAGQSNSKNFLWLFAMCIIVFHLLCCRTDHFRCFCSKNVYPNRARV